MGSLHNETYLFPRSVGRPLGPRALKMLISDLVARGTARAPFAFVTGRALPLPFGIYTELGEALLSRKRVPRGMKMAFRGDDPDALVAALATCGDGDRLVYFSDLAPQRLELPTDKPHRAVLYALGAPRTFELNFPEFDDTPAEVPGSACKRWEAQYVAVVLGATFDAPRHHPVAKLRFALQRHLGPIRQTFHILH